MAPLVEKFNNFLHLRRRFDFGPTKTELNTYFVNENRAFVAVARKLVALWPGRVSSVFPLQILSPFEHWKQFFPVPADIG